jgi:hypothetical protein
MKKTLTCLLSILCLHVLSLQANEEKPLESQAKAEINTLAVALKSTLQHGMKTDGAAASVKLCNIQAPLITQASSAEKGTSEWTVSRTSLQLRNPSNAPEVWVEKILKDFDNRKAQGENVSAITHSEIRDGEYFFVKAIPTQAACLACHGNNVAADVKTKLVELYPNDKATGYNFGDIRGAFIASQPVTRK